MRANFLTVLLLSCLFFACSESDEVKQLTEPGTITFIPKHGKIEPVYLTNAREGKSKIDNDVVTVTIMQDEKIIKDNVDIAQENKIELPAGDYSVFMRRIDQRERYKGKVAAENDGPELFSIVAGKETEVDIIMYQKYINVNLEFEGMEGKIEAWAGPEGFTPEDWYGFDENYNNINDFYAEKNFEVIVKWKGETKRFLAPNHPITYVTIVNKPKEEDPGDAEKIGSASFFYATYEGDGAVSIFQWN